MQGKVFEFHIGRIPIKTHFTTQYALVIKKYAGLVLFEFMCDLFIYLIALYTCNNYKRKKRNLSPQCVRAE